MKKEKKNPRTQYLGNGFSMAIVKKTSRMGLLIVKLITAFRGFKVGLESRRLRVVRRWGGGRWHQAVSCVDHGAPFCAPRSMWSWPIQPFPVKFSCRLQWPHNWDSIQRITGVPGRSGGKRRRVDEGNESWEEWEKKMGGTAALRFIQV